MSHSHKFCIAPMLDWTDTHCRYFMRLLSKKAFLYTEMVVTNAILKGCSDKLLKFNAKEQPLALQLGGSNPDDLAKCTQIAEKAGFNEVNLNVGCPSSRVQMQEIGACLMHKPELVAQCLRVMKNSADIEITIKHRIGLDDDKSYAKLRDFVGICSETGCKTFIVHARNAYLKGLSPKDNRSIPPLCYEYVYNLKQDFPMLNIVINGGITNLDECKTHLNKVNGVMLGRAVYYHPYLLAQVDCDLFADNQTPTRYQVMQELRSYLEQHLAGGGKVHQVTRHILGLACGLPNARKFRQLLSVEIHRDPYSLSVFDKAMSLLIDV